MRNGVRIFETLSGGYPIFFGYSGEVVVLWFFEKEKNLPLF